jgi:hypothetical protein
MSDPSSSIASNMVSHEDTLSPEQTTHDKGPTTDVASPPTAIMLSRYSLFTLSKTSTPSSFRSTANPYASPIQSALGSPSRSSRKPRPPSPKGLRRGSLSRSRERRLVEVNGIEPMTSCLQSRRSPN